MVSVYSPSLKTGTERVNFNLGFVRSVFSVVSLAVVFSVVTQRSSRSVA